MERPLSSSEEEETLVVADVLHRGALSIGAVSSSARLDSELLLASVLGISRTLLLVNSDKPLPPVAVDVFAGLIERRKKGEPTAYILGYREFWGLDFNVNLSVLVPRPDSELLVEEAVKFAKDRESLSFVDLGVGSGCLSISIIVELQKRRCDARCVGVDISSAAIEVAQGNAKRHGVDDRVRYTLGNWFETREQFSPPYDLIVANPPYVDRSEKLPVELSYEPPKALFAGQRGLAEVVKIIEQSSEMLRPGGLLLVEVGAGKRERLPEILAPFHERYEIEYLGDDSAFDRFTVLKMTRKAS